MAGGRAKVTLDGRRRWARVGGRGGRLVMNSKGRWRGREKKGRLTPTPSVYLRWLSLRGQRGKDGKHMR